MSGNRLKHIVDLASRFIEKYRNNPSIEGIILFGSLLVGGIDEHSEVDLLFVLSDSLLPTVRQEWMKGMGDKPVGGLWYEWEIFDDNTLPTTQYYKFDGKTIDCLFATVQMVKNTCRGVSMFHSFFQEGIVLYDKEGKIAQLSNEILLSLEDMLEAQRKKNYDAFRDLLWNLERFVKLGDVASSEIISVECCISFLIYLFALKKRISKYVKPQTLKRIMLDARKYLEPDIVNQVEKVLSTHEMSERLRILKDLKQNVKS